MQGNNFYYMFYKVKHLKDKFGIDSLILPELMDCGRRVRFESSNAIHGLIESQVVKEDVGMSYKLITTGGEVFGMVAIERIKEIHLTEVEFKDLPQGSVSQ